MKKDLSTSQQRIYEYIVQQTEEKGYPPSVREICSAVGLKSTSTVHGHLKRLEKNGYIRRDLTKPRAIEILQESAKKQAVNIPLVGKITAGEPITAVENIDDHFALPAQIIGKGDHFLLSVKGESMIDAGIFDGDYIIVRKQESCENGEIAVALIDDEATVKTFYKERDHIRLQPENSALKPIILNECQIMGKVVGLVRKM
ncbi:MAG: transcriptional repressor LexA [Christensenellales bacterium]|jgi:repressor LexA